MEKVLLTPVDTAVLNGCIINDQTASGFNCIVFNLHMLWIHIQLWWMKGICCAQQNIWSRIWLLWMCVTKKRATRTFFRHAFCSSLHICRGKRKLLKKRQQPKMNNENYFSHNMVSPVNTSNVLLHFVFMLVHIGYTVATYTSGSSRVELYT